ncbi:hypothetical protein GCM10027348_14380 [Hymenobacter tenuis]
MQSLQVSVLNREAPGALAEALGNVLTFFAQYFNVVRNLTDVQIGLLVPDLLERYWHWRFDEFLYVLREGVAGRWGKVYDRLDPATIHEWCRHYDDQVRGIELERQAQKEARERKLAELPATPRRYDNEHEVRQHLETLTDDQLRKGIAYYDQHPEEPFAEIKAELAAQVLLDRKKLELLKAVLGKASDAGTYAREASEEEYQKFKSSFVAERMAARTAPRPAQGPEPVYQRFPALKQKPAA